LRVKEAGKMRNPLVRLHRAITRQVLGAQFTSGEVIDSAYDEDYETPMYIVATPFCVYGVWVADKHWWLQLRDEDGQTCWVPVTEAEYNQYHVGSHYGDRP
jgi:hypothetical protein